MTEESYTSKVSFLDLDPMPVYGKETEKPRFSGRRIKRGLYRSGNNTCINADINGSYNILRKVFPTVFNRGIEDIAVRPYGKLNPLMGSFVHKN